jgi:ribulose kinase
MALLLGLDFGTGSVRAGVYDFAARRMLGEREAAYATQYPHPGWAEQSPLDWWEAAGTACRALMRDIGSPEIAGISAATTSSTVVYCRRDGTPTRPALLWMDCRAAVEADRTGRTAHPVMRYSGGSDAAEWLVPKSMWVKAHDPSAWAEAEVACECIDFVNHRMTGRWVASRMTATCKWNYDSVRGIFPADLYAEMGVPELADRLPTEVHPVGAPVGTLTAAAAEHLGIKGRPVVAQGGIDAHLGMVGANTIAPGELLMIGGTSTVHLFQLPAEAPVTGFWGPYPHALVDGHWLVEAGQVSAGSVLSWFSGTVFGLDADGLAALWREAEALPVGGAGLLTLDYFMGNRTPYRDPLLRGAVLGLSLGHSRAMLYRSAVEGVALASANVLERMGELGVSCRRIVSAGGYAKNPLWLRATVDALGRPVELLSDANLTIIGTAASAAVGAGLVPDLFGAAEAVSRPGRVVEPDPAAHARYRELFAEYIEVTGLLAPVSRRLAARQLGAPGR